MMWWYGNGMNGWGYALMAVGTVLFWGIVAFVVITLVRRRGVDDTTAPRSTPEQVLAERFARGQIDEPEYRMRLDALHTGTQLSDP